MIILWKNNGQMSVWSSAGEHTKVDLAKAIIETNLDFIEAGWSEPPCKYATNEKNEKVSHEFLMEHVDAYKRAMSKKSDIKSQLEKLF